MFCDQFILIIILVAICLLLQLKKTEQNDTLFSLTIKQKRNNPNLMFPKEKAVMLSFYLYERFSYGGVIDVKCCHDSFSFQVYSKIAPLSSPATMKYLHLKKENIIYKLKETKTILQTFRCRSIEVQK